ncbi:hypothetical protein NMK71_01655 [Weeksellaceae bacterium KMM 9713]|uniref:Uncharacterized protein n=1 Tax=Profundicola chukchiensis TaxID=2961959 RepID=A0A9X4MYF6_9FLAO|nr:hypothetical protein [Profundicola chukchiensis]MDG4945107.1 hypothetical protein [Profundicola chukchiensis]
MMKKFYVILFLVLGVITFAQSVKDLDAKNGFRHIKLGSHISEFKGVLEESDFLSERANVKTYNYIGGDIKELFGVKINSVSLYFYKNELFFIYLGFEDPFELHHYMDLKKNISNSYGNKTFYARNSNGSVVNGAIWQGEKVRMELNRVDHTKHKYKPIDYEYTTGYMVIIHRELRKKENDDNL